MARPARGRRWAWLLLLLPATGALLLALDMLLVSSWRSELSASFSRLFFTRPGRVSANKLAASLFSRTQTLATERRGVVIPIYDDIALLGLSLVLELRDMGVDLPVELPYCGDVNETTIAVLSTYAPLGDIRFYDACELALHTTVVGREESLFCADVEECHARFRGFEIKPLSVVLSRFQEIMLMDADTVYFQNPATLFDSDKFQTTGTLFFHDRASHEVYWMAGRLNDGTDNTVFHRFMSKFKLRPFRSIPTLPRENATLHNPVNLTLPFMPSDFLLASNVWNKRTGHQQDSSLVFWSKKKQPRATAILGSFVTSREVSRIQPPPSYGDKEFFFTACELAETQYAFSDFGISGFGNDFRDSGENKSTLCGCMAQVYPIKSEDGEHSRILHANSDFILAYRPKSRKKPLYYVRARPASFYPGSFGDRAMECPFNITGERLNTREEDRILRRQELHSSLEAHLHQV